MLTKGILIAIEGIDGSGKSTLAKNFAATLTGQGLPVVLTKEPGATLLGQRLRQILQEKDVPVNAQAEYLLFAADRAQHFQELIIPALKKNMIVVSDRMNDSSLVYQGYGRGLDLDMLKSINKWVMQDIQPNITFYVRISLEVAFERLRTRNMQLTSFEKEGTSFTQKLINGFETIYKNRTDVVILDGQQAPEILTQQASDYIKKIIDQS